MSDRDPATFNPGLHNSETNSDSEATFDSAAAPVGVPAPDLGSIGPYRLIRKLGEGGMGQVWLAEQSAPVKRQVALKIIKAGQYDGSALLRFNLERQTLAIMDHPAIAKVFDAGSTPAGQPYFVMEYVPGLPITNYCDTQRLPARERLALLVKVCEGVQHAHQKAIMHRDLKPSNILVVEVDGKPQPRIIDFGIAKAIAQQSEDETLVTRAGGTVGTPGYVSPEQADPSISDVDTRTDIYSLGVVLYELLTGVLPFDVKHWKTKPLHEVLRELHEDDPPRPSTRISGDPVSKTTAANRNTDPRQLASLLRGDLDWITLKTMEKDRTRRYGTPSELSADIGRYLRNEPITARPASAAYRAKKYVQRHKFGVAAVSAMVLLLIAFGVMQTIELRRITRERDRANRERDRVSRVTDFMTGMFKVSDPSEARGNTITAREILDKASKDVDAGLAQDPELQAQMMHVMGVVYKDLGLFARAQLLFERSADIQRRVLGPESAETLRSMDELAWILNQESHAAEAEKLQREIVDTKRRVLGSENPDTLKSMSNLAWTLDREGRYAEAENFDRQVLDIQERILKTDEREKAPIMNNLAATLGHEGHYAEAEKLKRETLDIRRRILGPEHPDTLTAMNNLAFTLQQEGHYAEAEKLLRETLNIQRRVLGLEHPDTLRSMNNLASTLVHEDHIAEALQLQREALSTKQRVLGPEHQDTLWAMKDLALTLQQEGHYSEAEKLQRQTIEIQRRVLGPERPNTLTTMSSLAATLNKEGHYSEAEKLLRQTVDMMRRVLGPEHPNTLATTDDLANTLDREGRYDEAEKLARETLELQRRVLGPEHPDAASTAYDLACVLAHSGRSDEAISFLREAIDHGLDPATDRAMATDPDLKPLRKDPRFEALASYARQHAATQKPD